MKSFTRLYSLAMIAVVVSSLYGCGGQQESPTINKGDAAPTMGKSAPPAANGGTAAKPKILGAPPAP